MVGVLRPVITLLAAAGALAACSASSGGASSSPPPSTVTSTVTVSPSTAGTPSAGPTTAVAARSCPLATTAFVRDTMGMRLGRLTVLRSGGRTVGCRFYALQGGALHASEHLPGPRQPVAEIVTQRYGSAVAAHNAFVLAARAGRNPQQTPLGGGRVGVCYQTDFYPRDAGQDWACGVSVGTVRVLVRTVDTTGTFSTASVTKAVLARV